MSTRSFLRRGFCWLRRWLTVKVLLPWLNWFSGNNCFYQDRKSVEWRSKSELKNFCLHISFSEVSALVLCVSLNDAAYLWYFLEGIDQILSSRQVYDVEIAGATVAFAGALILVLADVNTQSLIKTEWSHTIKTARFLKKATARHLEAKLETKTAPISAADSVLQIRNPHFNRLQSIDPSITVSDLSKSGVYRRMDSNIQIAQRVWSLIAPL